LELDQWQFLNPSWVGQIKKKNKVTEEKKQKTVDKELGRGADSNWRLFEEDRPIDSLAGQDHASVDSKTLSACKVCYHYTTRQVLC
jgi:hypothetical protein